MQRKKEESRKKLKYDAVDGLLSEIREHCGYADFKEDDESRDTAKKKKHPEEVWRWPEAQICALCSVGGDLLCCESCPASFHLSCIGVEASDIPDDNFYCNRCVNMPNVQMFPTETSSSLTVSANVRIRNEENRNWAAIGYHFKRFKDEKERKGLNVRQEAGPLTLADTVKELLEDECYLTAFGMANPVDFTLPKEILSKVKLQPNDSLEVKRPHICNKVCAECKLKDDWSPMLNCDFCGLIWHQKCLFPPLFKIPRLIYWRCPRHTQELIEGLFQGEEISQEKKEELFRKYDKIKPSYDLFESFCKATEKQRMEATIKEGAATEELYYIENKDSRFSSIPSILKPKINCTQKSIKAKKNNKMPFFGNAFTVIGMTDKVSMKKTKNIRKAVETPPAERNDQSLDELDEKRSIPFTEEDLILSIMPINETEKVNRLTQKLLGTDKEMSASLLNRTETLILKSKAIYRSLAEIEMIKLMKQGLDPIETVRGSGVQSQSNSQEKSIRKKEKSDVELLFEFFGIGSDHFDRKVNSFHTEEFFRRSAPPPCAQDILNPRMLRECAMNSQKEAYEMPDVFKYHSNPENLKNFILMAYDMSFKSAEQRDSYYVSSMTSFSKEPIAALTSKWAEESRHFRIQSDVDAELEEEKHRSSLSREESMSPTLGRSTDQVNEEKEEDDDGGDDEDDNGDDKDDDEAEGEEGDDNDDGKEEKRNLSATPELEESLSRCVSDQHEARAMYFSPDNSTALGDNLLGYENLIMLDEYEKAASYAGSVHKDSKNSRDGTRRKSESDIIDKPIWPSFQKNLRILAMRISSIDKEHNYSALSLPTHSYIDQYDGSYSPTTNNLETNKNEENRDSQGFISLNFASLNARVNNYINSFYHSRRKRGRPAGTKNRKGEAVPKKKRHSLGSVDSKSLVLGRGRSGRPRGNTGRRGSHVISNVEEGSGRQSQELSSEEPESPESESESESEFISYQLRDKVEETRKKYAKLMILKSLQDSKNSYFKTRDAFLLKWPPEKILAHKEMCLFEKINSLIPFEPRFFLPSQRVLARLKFRGNYLPIAIQRCLTKLGTARDCHVRLDKYTNVSCHVFAEYHFDIIREYQSNSFFLSTLATEVVIVNGIVVRRPQLTQPELAAQFSSNTTPISYSSSIKCQCQIYSDQIIAHQENRGNAITSGIVKLEDGARIQVGCLSFTFKKTPDY